MNSFLISLGVMLLYFPPFLVWSAQGVIRRFENVIWILSFSISLVLTDVMVYLLPASQWVFLLYLGLFWLIMLVGRRGVNLTWTKSMSLAVYACFAVSVLWEWPVQITIPQYPDAVVMSSFKALGVFFFFLTLYEEKWMMSKGWITALGLTIGWGVGLILLIQDFGINQMFWWTHLYRLPWIILLIWAITDISKPRYEKNINTDTTNSGKWTSRCILNE